MRLNQARAAPPDKFGPAFLPPCPRPTNEPHPIRAAATVPPHGFSFFSGLPKTHGESAFHLDIELPCEWIPLK